MQCDGISVNCYENSMDYKYFFFYAQTDTFLSLTVPVQALVIPSLLSAPAEGLIILSLLETSHTSARSALAT